MARIDRSGGVAGRVDPRRIHVCPPNKSVTAHIYCGRWLWAPWSWDVSAQLTAGPVLLGVKAWPLLAKLPPPVPKQEDYLLIEAPPSSSSLLPLLATAGG